MAWAPLRAARILRELAAGVIPAAVVAYAASKGSPQDADKTSTIVYPAIYGAIALGLVLFAFEAVPFAWRFATGRPAKRARRTLLYLNTDRVEKLLRQNPPTGSVQMWADQHTTEIHDFADDLKRLLVRSAWPDPGIGSGWPSGRMVKGIEIYVPEGGNAGLVALGKALSHWGYETVVVDDDVGRQSVDIVIGEATK